MMSPNASFIQTTHKLDVRDYTTDHQQISFSKAIQEMDVLIGDTHLFFQWARNIQTENNTYFCSTKRGSKNSVVILLAYREQPVMEHRPERHQRYRSQSVPLTPWSTVFGGSYYLPDKMNTIPAKQASFALALSEPPTLVHFIPKSAKMEPKKPRLTAAIISPRQAWM